MQLSVFTQDSKKNSKIYSKQLLKWIGNKQRFAQEIISQFPDHFNSYFEPFLGSGAVLGVLAPEKGIGSDIFLPLIDIWQTVKNNPTETKNWYRTRWEYFKSTEKKEAYNNIKNAYNENPNAADLLFISRSCYGGVVRFRKTDGYISTPVGIHDPIKPDEFDQRVDLWHNRITYTDFYVSDFEEIMLNSKSGDLIYCDPPYFDTQSILYGAQAFSLKRLLNIIEKCTSRGVYVALSIDGTKKSGKKICDIEYPKGLFKREIMVNVGKSMLKRFQMNGLTLEEHEVKDRLLLTY